MKQFLKWTGLVVFAGAVGLALAIVFVAGGQAQLSASVVQGVPPAASGDWRSYGSTDGYTSTQPLLFYGHGPGMMMGRGRWNNGYDGWGMGPSMMGGYGWSYPANATPLTLDQAARSVNDYLTTLGNPDLKLVEVMQFDNGFYAEVEEKSTSVHAFELLIDLYTAAVYPEPGPNMMWNTKYGHMGGRWGQPSEALTVTPEQARTTARQWLDAYRPGTKAADEVDAFYGYYTIHTVTDGQVAGMLSVNGYTGQVWYHTWHGVFLGMKELEG